MAKEKKKKLEICPRREGPPVAASVGAVLLDLRDALRQAERCRLALLRLGFSRQRWQEIVRDVDQEQRFLLRPQILDAIVTHLLSVGEPVNRPELVRTLNLQGAGTMQRIQQAITLNLRSGNLTLHAGNMIGLPALKKKPLPAD
jgi:hypothetical protein